MVNGANRKFQNRFAELRSNCYVIWECWTIRNNYCLSLILRMLYVIGSSHWPFSKLFLGQKYNLPALITSTPVGYHRSPCLRSNSTVLFANVRKYSPSSICVPSHSKTTRTGSEAGTPSLSLPESKRYVKHFHRIQIAFGGSYIIKFFERASIEGWSKKEIKCHWHFQFECKQRFVYRKTIMIFQYKFKYAYVGLFSLFICVPFESEMLCVTLYHDIRRSWTLLNFKPFMAGHN